MDGTIRVRTLAAFAVAGFAGALVALVLLWTMRADAAPGETDTTFVPITSCRLVDTRPANMVGPRNTPLGAKDTYTVDVQHASTRCAGKIPAAATALSLNVTAVLTSAPTFVTVWDQGPWPGTSSLNPVPGPAVPNAVTTKLSAGDTFEMYNEAGSTHLVVDIGGYYTDASLDELTARLTALETAGVDADVLDRLVALETAVGALQTDNATQATTITALQTENTTQATKITALETVNASQASKITALESKTASMSTVTVDGHPTVRFSNVNLQIVSGGGTTAAPVNGRGNLIVGYNENASDQRTGSHNLVVGPYHSYSSHGGFVAGGYNTISGSYPTVAGGFGNTASGAYGSVSGGIGNTASGYNASVSGGQENSASGNNASVSGGRQNTASGNSASVFGGYQNTASGDYASVSSGTNNTASGVLASVSGGVLNTASGYGASVSGGYQNTASGAYETVAGGDSVLCTSTNTVVCGEGTIIAPD